MAACAAAGIECQIAVVETAPLGKLQQMLSYGAQIVRIRGFGLDVDTVVGFAIASSESRGNGTADWPRQWVGFV